MKLANIDINEITIHAVYVITCFMCEKELLISSSVGNTVDAAVSAASQGWHSYETADEHCSIACPSCIKEAKENEAESKAEASA